MLLASAPSACPLPDGLSGERRSSQGRFGSTAATGKALEPVLRTKQASHLTPESEKGRKEHHSFGWPLSSFPKQLPVVRVAEGLGKPPCLGGELQQADLPG